MAVTVGNTSNSGDPGAVTSYSWNHTCAANTTCLVVAISAEDAGGSSDLAVSGVTYNSVAMTKAREYISGTELVSIWYLLAPSIGSSLAIAVTHSGKCTDTAASAIDLLGTDTSDPFDDVNGFDEEVLGAIANTESVTLSVPTGSIMIGALICDISSAANLSVSNGTEIAEIDLGATIHSSGYGLESGGTATVSWTSLINWSGDALGCVFQPPSVTTTPPGPPPASRTIRHR